MACVLRLIDTLDNITNIKSTFNLNPYRTTEKGVDGGRQNCLYYSIDADDADVNQNASVDIVMETILRSTNIIEVKKSYPALRIEIDIAVELGSEDVSKSVSIEIFKYPELMFLEPALIFSIYKTDA